MKLIYTNPNRVIVENVKNVLQNEGIEVMLQNEYAGGGIGEIAPIDAWPELWLKNPKDFDKANKLLDKIKKNSETTWKCSNCGEINAGNFELCWKCNSHNEDVEK